MPDYTLCINDKCPSKDKCWRFASKPDPEHYQSYTRYRVFPDAKQCTSFWPKGEKNVSNTTE